jgi:hypothetical protein
MIGLGQSGATLTDRPRVFDLLRVFCNKFGKKLCCFLSHDSQNRVVIRHVKLQLRELSGYDISDTISRQLDWTGNQCGLASDNVCFVVVIVNALITDKRVSTVIGLDLAGCFIMDCDARLSG